MLVNVLGQSSPEAVHQTEADWFSFTVGPEAGLKIQASSFLVLLSLLAVLGIALARYFLKRRGKYYDVDTVELGYGKTKVRLKPNELDRQIAYSVWVELSTRKIGLPIDLEHDVISEVYDSWYAFFGVTRDLLKTVPVTKIKHDSTRQLVRLSISVLNKGLRPHLTKWQARYRHWYENKTEDQADFSPQEMQKTFPKYSELTTDLTKVNQQLIAYRKTLYLLITGEEFDVDG